MCGYNHSHGHCPAFNRKCFYSNNTGYFTTLVRKPRSTRGQVTTPFRCRELRGRSPRSTSRSRRRSSSRSLSRSQSRSPSRGRQTYRSSSRHSSHSPSQDHHRRRSPCRRRHTPTPHRHQVSHIMSFDPNTAYHEDQLYTDWAPDGQTSFHTTLQMVTKQGCKPLPVKVDHGTDINTIPLTHYNTIFPQHFIKGHLKKNVLRSTASIWSLHDGQKKHFLGFFTIDIQHKTLPRLKPLSFYIFEDTTNPFLLLSYSASIHLGIVEFKIPNEANANAMVSSVTNTLVNKKVSYKVPLCSSTPAEVIPTMPELKKPILKQKRTKTCHYRTTITLCRTTTQQKMI